MAKTKILTPPDPLSKESITVRFMEVIHQIIAHRREGAKNYSQVASVIGMPSQNMSRLNDLKQFATTEMIAKLCHHYGVNDSYIMRGIGNMEEIMPITQRVEKLELQFMDIEKKIDLIFKKKVKLYDGSNAIKA